MTLEQLYRRNERFQAAASQLNEVAPGGNMIEFSSLLIRGAKKMDAQLKKLISTKSEMGFHGALDKIEEEMDEIVYMLDRLDEANRTKKVKSIADFLKEGYELLSIYSLCCDQLIERKMKTREVE